MRHLLIVLTSLALMAALPSCVAMADPPSNSQSSAPRKAQALDDLFASLKAAPDQQTADAIAAKIWAQWRKSGRDDVDIMLSRAMAGIAASRRNLGLALMLLDEIIELMPEFPEPWNVRATLHFSMGHPQQSLSDIEQVLTLEPRHFGALAGRAAIHADAQQWTTALEDYRAALAINPFLRGRERILAELERKAGERGP